MAELDSEVAAALELVRASLKADVDAGKTPGVAVAVVSGDGALLEEGFGLSDVSAQTPMTERSLVRVASVTKLFTATALMQLRDSGTLELDDLVTRHLPEFGVKSPYSDCPPIRIRHLVCHASGLPREPEGAHWLTHEAVPMDRAFADLAEREVLYPPWTELHYSNLGFGVLGMIIEKVSGRTLADYIRGNVLQPLGMNDSGFSVPERARTLLASGYYPSVGDGPMTEVPQWELGALSAGGGIYSSVSDIALFMLYQFDEHPAILRRSSVTEMWLPIFLYPNVREGHGVGWWSGQVDGRALIGHGGSVDGYRTQLYLNPERRIGVAVFANSTYDATGACRQALDWITDATERAAARAQKTSVRFPIEGAAEYIGCYRWRGFGDWWVAETEKELALVGSKDSGTRGAPRLERIEGDVFRVRGGGSNGEIARFERNADGEIVRLWVSAYPYTRSFATA